MGKTSPNYEKSMNCKQNKQSDSSKNKYLKPGALAQLRHNRAALRFCADLGRKRVLVSDSKKVNEDVLETMNVDKAPTLSFGSITFSPIVPYSRATQKVLPGTPRTPPASDCISDSRLESLPMEILVKILCNLHHNQLRAVFHVSQKIRKAVLLARQYYFNYTTPDRSFQEMVNAKTSLATEHWALKSSHADGKRNLCPSPHTPKAPRHGPRPPSRFNESEMSQLATVLFQEPPYPVRCMMSPRLPKSDFKSLTSNRYLLFYKDELCQAAAENKLK